MRRSIIIAIAVSAAVHAVFIGILTLFAYREPIGKLGGGGTGGTVIVTIVGGDEGGTGGEVESPSSRGTRRRSAPVKHVIPSEGKARAEGSLVIKKEKQGIPPLAALGRNDRKDATSGPVREGGDGSGGIGGDGSGWGSAGSGGGAGGGHGGGIGPGRGRGDQRLSTIWAKINRSKYYPWNARHHAWEGLPRVTFKIGKEGQILYVKLASSCGIPELDQAALETVRRSAPLPHYPKPITITIRYSLSE